MNSINEALAELQQREAALCIMMQGHDKDIQTLVSSMQVVPLEGLRCLRRTSVMLDMINQIGVLIDELRHWVIPKAVEDSEGLVKRSTLIAAQKAREYWYTRYNAAREETGITAINNAVQYWKDKHDILSKDREMLHKALTIEQNKRSAAEAANDAFQETIHHLNTRLNEVLGDKQAAIQMVIDNWDNPLQKELDRVKGALNLSHIDARSLNERNLQLAKDLDDARLIVKRCKIQDAENVEKIKTLKHDLKVASLRQLYTVPIPYPIDDGLTCRNNLATMTRDRNTLKIELEKIKAAWIDSAEQYATQRIVIERQEKKIKQLVVSIDLLTSKSLFNKHTLIENQRDTIAQFKAAFESACTVIAEMGEKLEKIEKEIHFYKVIVNGDLKDRSYHGRHQL